MAVEQLIDLWIFGGRNGYGRFIHGWRPYANELLPTPALDARWWVKVRWGSGAGQRELAGV